MSYKVFTRECVSCGVLWDVLLEHAMEPHVCSRCGKPTEWRPSAPKLIFFKEGIYEHIQENPVYISSMQQLRDECAAHGVRSEYAESSSCHRSTTHKEV
jgi:hypothetical protein